MGLSEAQKGDSKPKIDKESAKRQLWIEYIKAAVTVLIFLAGLALITNFINGYFAVKYGYIFDMHPGYRNLVLLLMILAYIIVFISGLKKLGFKFADRIDELKTILDNLD